MKRIVSIPLMLLILFSGINVKIASHFCRGNFSATKVSLNGELASCGMDNKSGTKSTQDLISTLCCEDVISSFSISTNYLPYACSCLPDIGQAIKHIFIVQEQLFISQVISVFALSGNKKPPGGITPSAVEQQVICIFRI